MYVRLIWKYETKPKNTHIYYMSECFVLSGLFNTDEDDDVVNKNMTVK